MGKLRPEQTGPVNPHSQAGFKNGNGEGTTSQAGGSGVLITVFPLPLELGQPRPMITMVAQGLNRARLQGQVCSLLEAGNGGSGEPKQGCEYRVFSDLKSPHTCLGRWRKRLPESAVLEGKPLPPSNSGQPLAREELLPSRHFLGKVASPCSS